MEIWVVFHYYNARTDNGIHGVFESKDMAIKYVEDYIEESKRLSLEIGRPEKWRKPCVTSYGDVEYHTGDYGESSEVTSHIIQMKETSIREDISKVLSGEKDCLKISGIHNFDYYLDVIREIVGDEDPIEIEDFNGWEMDFYYEFIFKEKDYIFHGSVYHNAYTIERRG